MTSGIIAPVADLESNTSNAGYKSDSFFIRKIFKELILFDSFNNNFKRLKQQKILVVKYVIV